MRVVPDENMKGEKIKDSLPLPPVHPCATETKTPSSNNWRKISFFLSGFQSFTDKRQEGREAQPVAAGVCANGCPRPHTGGTELLESGGDDL